MDSDWAERVEKVEQERDRYRQLYQEALERCRMLERGLLGQKSERLPPNEAQLALQVLGGLLEARDGVAEDPEPPAEPKTQQIPAHERRPRAGRQVPPDAGSPSTDVLAPLRSSGHCRGGSAGVSRSHDAARRTDTPRGLRASQPTKAQLDRQQAIASLPSPDPPLGNKRLDELDDEQIQRLTAALADKSSKTVNNILTTLNTLLSVAVQWGVLEQMPAKVRLLKVTRKDAAFYDFDEYDRLVEAAVKVSPEVHLQVLLGGDAGLRPGEVRALHWTSVDFRRQQLTIERHEYKGQFTLPKHDKIRRVPMTDALTEALKAYRHLRGPLVLYRDEACRLLTPRTQRYWLGKAQRLANLPDKGPHTLRHTFCSHLAMRGAPTKAIQELAGHADLTTTQRYMHLSPATLDASIRLLDRRPRELEKEPESLTQFLQHH